jgi:transcriptional regulator GlxA family with amidase domain
VQHVVTESNGVYCGGGVYAALDLALHLVERLCDHEVAARCAQALQIEMPRPCQAGFALLPMSRRHTDASIERAEEWVHRHCREEIRFNALARELGMSPRNFMRRFKAATGLSPTDYLQGLRVNAARRLLEDEHITVQEVGASVGYEDGAFFRDVFKRHTGVAPGEYRRTLAATTPTLTPRAPGTKGRARHVPRTRTGAAKAPARSRRHGATP